MVAEAPVILEPDLTKHSAIFLAERVCACIWLVLWLNDDGMPKNKRKRTPKTVLRLPDLQQSKSAVLNSLASQSSQPSDDHAIREFIEWDCSEPRLAFNKTAVTRYRIFLEQASYASSTINLQLAAIRRLAYEAADAGLLSPDLAAEIRRVKGAKKFAVRTGNWLTAEQRRQVLGVFDRNTLRGIRDYAMVAVLRITSRRSGRAPCSRSSATGRTLGVRGSRRQGRPCSDRLPPFWIAAALRAWMAEAKVTDGPIFCAINKAGRIAAHSFSPNSSGAL